MGGLSWTFSREVGRSVRFGPVVYHDGQGFVVRKAHRADSPEDLAGQPICVSSETAAVGNLARWFGQRDLALDARVFATDTEAWQAFAADRCIAYSADGLELAKGLAVAASRADFDVLPALISKEPLAPRLHAGDEEFFEIVRWTVFALIDAEDLGVTSENVEALLASTADPEVISLLTAPGVAGLAPRWVFHIIKEVGNYGEVYARNLGAGSHIELPRGANQFTRNGGILYAPPMR